MGFFNSASNYDDIKGENQGYNNNCNDQNYNQNYNNQNYNGYNQGYNQGLNQNYYWQDKCEFEWFLKGLFIVKE